MSDAARLAVFGYGSLASHASAAETLGRPVEVSEPVRLRGWARRWSQIRNNARVEKSFAPSTGDAAIEWCLSLNLEPAPGSAGPNGVLIEVTEAEADRIDLREIRYRRVDVSGAIDNPHGFDRVIAYIARSEHTAPAPPPSGAVIIAAYLETVEEAFAALGPDQLELFRETTGPPPVGSIEAVLVRDEIPPGNPSAW
jgi:hypothetical protein